MRTLIIQVGLLVLTLTTEVPAQTVAAPLAATVTVGSGSRIEGSGREVNEVRQIGSFSAVRVNGPVDIVLKASEREQVTVHFDDNLAALIETRVIQESGPTLEIRVSPTAAFRSSKPPRVTVEFRALNAISVRGSGNVQAESVRGPLLAVAIAGSGDVTIDQLDVDVLGVSIGGSGNFTATGRAAEQGYSIGGSGDVFAEDLIGQTVKVRVAGSGDVQVHAEQLLDVAIAGAGDVLYRGTPVIRKSVAGSGEVRRLK
ncbi:MAG TPA: head GIN domain-containing protein [Burkholderiaceae bacterium]|nr:head GIN domain-containing protein [Burkholderiaceae bacterium]